MPSILIEKEEQPYPESRRRRRLVWWFVISAVLGTVLGLAIALWWIREPMSDLSAENLQQARQQWRAHEIQDYDLMLQIHPPGQATPNRFEVVVRKGKVVKLLCNDQPDSTHEPELYSIDGLFDMLNRELDLAAEPESQYQTGGGKSFLRVRFDEEYGYPERYLRVIGGSNQSSTCIVEMFTPDPSREP